MATIKYLNDNGDYEEVSTIKIVEEGSDGGQLEYWGVGDTTNTENIAMLLACSTLIRGEVGGAVYVLPIGLRADAGIYIPEALAVDRSAEIIFPGQDYKTVGDIIDVLIPDLNALGFVPMTKEQFYTI